MIHRYKNLLSIGLTLVILLLAQSCSSSKNEGYASVQLKTDTVYHDGDYQVEVVNFEALQPLLYQTDERLHVINFWATWCIPCVAELPYFQELVKKHPNIELTLISLDFSSKIRSDLLPFLKDRQLKERVILLNEPDANSWIPQIDADWTGAIPATIIYSGQKRNFYEQSFTFETLEKEVQQFQNQL